MAREFFQSIDRELQGQVVEKISVERFGLRILWDLVLEFFRNLFGRGPDAKP